MGYEDKKLKGRSGSRRKKALLSVDTGPFNKTQARKAEKQIHKAGHAVRRVKRDDGKFHLYIDGPLHVGDAKHTKKDLTMINETKTPIKNQKDLKKAQIAPKKPRGRGRPRKVKKLSKQYGNRLYRQYLREESALAKKPTRKEKKQLRKAKKEVKAAAKKPMSQYERRKARKAEKLLAEAAKAKTQKTQNKKARQAKKVIKQIEKATPSKYQRRQLKAAEKNAAKAAKTPKKAPKKERVRKPKAAAFVPEWAPSTEAAIARKKAAAADEVSARREMEQMAEREAYESQLESIRA